jgi:hypothetical protein
MTNNTKQPTQQQLINRANTPKASNAYLKEVLGIIDDEVKEMQARRSTEAKARQAKARQVIQEILQEDQDIKNKQHIKRIK